MLWGEVSLFFHIKIDIRIDIAIHGRINTLAQTITNQQIRTTLIRWQAICLARAVVTITE